jgi:hypothetical protein
VVLDRGARGLGAALLLTWAVYAAIAGLLFLTNRCEMMAGAAQARAGDAGAQVRASSQPGQVPAFDDTQTASLAPAVAAPAFAPALDFVGGADSA